ncbi:hypothetical protein D3C72_2092530 [compost metagenome]
MFKDATAGFALTVQALGDVVIATRGDKAGKILQCRLLISPGLGDGQAQRVFEFQLQQGVVVAADQDEVRTPIDFFTGMVVGQLLGAVVTAQNASHQGLTDAEGLHLGQVLFQREAPQCQLLVVHAGQRLLDFLH